MVPGMRTRPFGRLGHEVSELALGTWGLSGDGYGPVAEAEVDRVLDRALELGITLFETADVYGRGAMEKKLGARLAGASVRIVTKIGTLRAEASDGPEPAADKRFDPASLGRAFEASRERLGRDKLDVVLLHNPSEQVLRDRDAAYFLQQLVTEGKLEAWGVSAGSHDVAHRAIALGADVVELAYNPFASRDLHRLSDELAVAPTALLARSVLAHGLLTGHWGPERVFEEGDHRALRWKPNELRHRLRQLDALRPLVGGEVLSLRAAALRFALANALVTSVVLGPRRVRQLDELVREAGPGPRYLPDTALADLSTRLKRYGIAP
ncbi:MAG: aldo/keto reductase [Myxococcales bacterium]|nr:aldo/keto reductase [Myxococcales bacterium]